MDDVVYVLGFWIMVVVWLLARNEVAHRVCLAFINDDDLFPECFKRLPSYTAMMLSPRYQLLWTKAQWVRYVKES